ncbi:MAG: hypothetical protein EOM64_10435 [Erysipelotrichia bacterium]|nr:hypothetical protein [Erysipelotrichia bacterium]
MPAATTHIEFSRDVYNSLPPSMQRQIKNLPMYFLGSQGPDLFFFHHLSVLPGSLRKIGARMHNEHIMESLSFMKYDCSGNPHLYSYYMGFLTHYALDSLVHPLVEYHAYARHAKTGTPEGEAHFTIEGELDQYMLSTKHHPYNLSSDLSVSKEDAHLLAQMYHELLETVFHIQVPAKQISAACSDCRWATDALKPSAGKYAVVYRMESLFKQPHMISGMMLWNKNDCSPALNQDHQPFEVPGYSSTKDRRSFTELYRDAGVLAVSLMNDLSAACITRDFLGRPLQQQSES